MIVDALAPADAPVSQSAEKVPILRLIQLVPGGLLPRRADRSVGGTLPGRAMRHCEPVLAASGFGWYSFLPFSFELLWNGSEVFYRMESSPEFTPLRSIHYPGFAEAFDEGAPEEMRGAAPAFLSASIQPGLVQIWPGLVARTAPGWHLLVRPVANLARPGGYELLEGIIATDTWLGPLFTNVRLMRTNVPILFDCEVPFMQLQPVRQGWYGGERLGDFTVAGDMSGMTEGDWVAYARTIVKPMNDPQRRRGAYAAEARKAAAGHDAIPGLD